MADVAGGCCAAAQKSPTGFMAKISDFGLTRELELAGCASRSKSRLITHIAPEVLHTGLPSKARDNAAGPLFVLCRFALSSRRACSLVPYRFGKWRVYKD
jgi:hypothetical protein